MSYSLCGLCTTEKISSELQTYISHMRFTILQYSNQFALGDWSWRVLSYRVQRKVITSDLGRSYLLPTRAIICLISLPSSSSLSPSILRLKPSLRLSRASLRMMTSPALIIRFDCFQITVDSPAKEEPFIRLS